MAGPRSTSTRPDMGEESDAAIMAGATARTVVEDWHPAQADV